MNATFSRFLDCSKSPPYQIAQHKMEHTSSTMLSSRTDASFTKFNDLPPELRIKIWQFAMPDPRIVVLKAPRHQVPASLEDALTQALNYDETWLSTTQIPPLLHVNAEARHEALKHYTLAFGAGEVEPRVYVDFNRDTVYFGNAELTPENISLWPKTRDLEKIQRLATVVEGMWRVLWWSKCSFPFIERLIFVHDTEKIKLGPLPELVEDESEQVESEPSIEIKIEEHDARGLEITTHVGQSELESPNKKREREAKAEVETLLQIFPIQWEKRPAFSTAVFNKNNKGDIAMC